MFLELAACVASQKAMEVSFQVYLFISSRCKPVLSAALVINDDDYY